MCRPSQTPHLTVSPACLSLHGTLILEPGAFDSGRVALHEKLFYTIFIHNIMPNSSVVFNMFHPCNLIFIILQLPPSPPFLVHTPVLIHPLSPIHPHPYIFHTFSSAPPPLSPWHVQTPNRHNRKVCKNRSKINSTLLNCTIQV